MRHVITNSMQEHTKLSLWNTKTISIQKKSYQFDFSFAQLILSLESYEHDTVKLVSDFYHTLPSFLTEISETILKSFSEQLAKHPEKALHTKNMLLVDKINSLHIKPCYPDKPLVILVPETLEVCPATEIQVFVLSLADIGMYRDTTLMHTWNTLTTPKKTLYGDPTTGIISYTYRENFITDETKAYTLAERYPLCIVHPIHIINRTDKTMQIKEILVNFPQLSIFDYSGILMSERIRYEYSSNRIQISTEQHGKQSAASLVQKPVVAEPSFVLQGLQFFKNMVGF
mgnify:FL=1